MIDKLAWIGIENKSVLSSRTFGKDKFYIPGGKRETGETDEQALKREIKEELSVDILEDTIKFMGVFEAQAHGHPLGTMVKMTCFFAEYTGQLQGECEIEEIKWLNYADKDKISDVDILIFDFLKKNELLD